MKIFNTLILSLALASSGALANLLPIGKDTDDIMIGVTGMFAAIKGGEVQVTQITPDTPVAGKLEKGDVLLAVNGESLEIQDPRHPIGLAINAAEGKDGKMTFDIKRGGAKRSVRIQLEAIGSYSATYPINCKKSQRIIDETAAFILKNGGPGEGINGNLEGLFLLSTGNPKYLPALKKYASEIASKPGGSSVWYLGFSGIFLGEYYLATGDKQVLPTLKERCDRLADGQYYGGWSHGVTKANPGYVTGGLVHAAGAQAFTTMTLARECGVDVDEKAYDDALRLFFRYAGRGGVPYGDHHPELWWASNGKNGGTAAALALLPDEKFQGGAKLLALSETDTYWGNEGGHGSSFGNQTFRNIVDALVRESHPESWRRHKDEMIWYYELARMPGGGFRTSWFPGHGTIGKEPMYQTGLVAMAYTAHLGNLRICGKPRTEFSVPHRPTAVEASLPADDFQRTDFIEGATINEKPHEIVKVFSTLYDESGQVKSSGAEASKNDKRKKKMPAAYYAKLMRHYSPTVRDWAAHGLGFLGEEAIPEIKKALDSDDDRLRVAGLDAISCTLGWGIGKTESNITPEMIKEHFLPQILRPLKDPRAPMWEKRHALMALGSADAGSIKANLDTIRPYLADPEWWLRAAAFNSMHPLIKDTDAIRSMLPAMLASYDSEFNVGSWRWGATDLFRKAIAANPEVKDEIINGMAASLSRLKIREGFEEPIDTNKIFETLRYVDMQKNPQNAVPVLPSIERVYPHLEILPARWTVTGAKWGNIGLAKAAELLGEEGRPFIASMKRIRPDLASRPTKVHQGENLTLALERLDEVVEAYEKKFGEVKGE
jgi:hypothetical protein